MNFDEFTGQVQNRIEYADTGETLRAIRATLTTLGERLQEGEATDLAAPLPMEIDRYLIEADSGQSFEWDEFVERVWEREAMDDPDDRADAAYHAQVIVDLVRTQVPPSDFQQLRDQLPEDQDDEDWGKLFEVVDAGGWGEAEEAQTGGGPQPGDGSDDGTGADTGDSSGSEE